MKKLNALKVLVLMILTDQSLVCFSQSNSTKYVPCQEMPDLITKYNTDYRVLSRFYSPASANAFRGNGAGGADIGSPEKRTRLDELNNEYLKKLQALNWSQYVSLSYAL